MRVRLVGSVVVSWALALSACSNGDTDPGSGGGGTGGGGTCAGIERVCTTAEDCPTLTTCSGCGECLVDPGIRACEDTSDCPIGRACRVPEGGTAKSCVRVVCDGHDDCAEEEACDTGRHACVPGDCVSLGCPEGTHCREENSTCVECLGNSHCEGTDRPYCAEAINTCVPCEYDADCGQGKVCVEHACVACETDDDCSAPNRFCRDDGTCASCLSDSDCPTGVTCLPSGRCDLGPIAGEDCDPGRACAPGHRCEGPDAGVCFLSCDPYAPACGEGEVCAFLGDDDGAIRMANGRPIGICARTDAAQGHGEPCDATRSCSYDLLCLPDGPTIDRCRRPCDPATGGEGVCETGETCKGLPIGANDARVGFCMRPTTWLDPCDGNGDCGPGLGCVITVEGEAIVPLCNYTTGTGEPLAACDADDDCRSGTCLSSGEDPAFCWGACSVDADCGFGTCGVYGFTLTGGGTAEVSGCRATCQRDGDCTVYDGFVCSIGVDPDLQLFAECAAGDPAGAGAGSFCTADAQCRMGVCFDDGGTASPAEDGFCLGPCETDGDCGAGTFCRAAPLLVQQTPPVYDAIQVCWGADCLANSDCPAGRTCDFEPDPENLGGDIRFSCAPAYGDLLPGQACTGNAECMSGICVTLSTGTSLCYGPCRTSADCGGGSFCDPGAFVYTTPNGSQVNLPGCITF